MLPFLLLTLLLHATTVHAQSASDGWAWLGESPIAELGVGASIAHPVLAARHDPILAYAASAPGSYSLASIVSRWTGAHWTPLGAPFPGGTVTAATVDRKGRTLVCSGDQPTVRRWTGSAWEAVGGDIARESGQREGRHVALDCGAIVVAGDDAPTVSWTASSARKVEQTFAARWDADARKWQALRGALARGRLTTASLAVDGAGQVVLAASELDAQHRGTSRVFRWGKRGWEPLGPDIADTFGAVLSAHRDELVLAAESTKVPRRGDAFLARLRGKRWQPLPSSGPAAKILLARSASGKLVSASLTSSPDAAPGQTDLVRVRVLEGESWCEAGALALGDGADDATVTFDFALDGLGRPLIAWTQESRGGARLAAKRGLVSIP